MGPALCGELAPSAPPTGPSHGTGAAGLPSAVCARGDGPPAAPSQRRPSRLIPAAQPGRLPGGLLARCGGPRRPRPGRLVPRQLTVAQTEVRRRTPPRLRRLLRGGALHHHRPSYVQPSVPVVQLPAGGHRQAPRVQPVDSTRRQLHNGPGDRLGAVGESDNGNIICTHVSPVGGGGGCVRGAR
jgi:hypothetical protein